MGAALSQPLRSRWRWVVGIALTVTSIAVLVRTTRLDELGSAVQLALREPTTLAVVALLYAAAFGLRAFAWGILLRSPRQTNALFSNLHTSLFLNHLLPFKAGEIARPLLAMQHGVEQHRAIASTVTARVLDFASLGVLALLMLPTMWPESELRIAWLLAVGGACCGLLLLLVLRAHPVAFGPRPVRERALELHRSLRAIPGATILRASPFVLASWVLESSVLLGAAHLLGLEMTLQTAVGATAFTILFQTIHVTPGGVGIYETAMTSALVSQSFAAEEALSLAVLTHVIKFAYSFSVGAGFSAFEGVFLLRGRHGQPVKRASRFEVVMARLWNVVNEGKPFTIVFTAFTLVLLSLPQLTSTGYWLDATVATVALVPLLIVFYLLDFPLKLRWALWAYLAVFMLATGTPSPGAIGLILATYLGFTVVLWGTIYYHLRIGTRWSNGLRFFRLVVENPDPTSGNFLEQVPKLLLLVALFQFGLGHEPLTVSGTAVLTAVGVAASGLLLHQWFFTWVPPLPQPRLNVAPPAPVAGARARRVIAIVIDGCRDDRLREADTPCIDQLRTGGLDVTTMSTVYPARTVTCFSSMLTGAPPAVHGMHSNFVPNLGIKCESVFDVLEEAGLRGRMVGIAHLIDAFGDQRVEPVTAVMHNDEIDDALIARAREVMLREAPDLLVLQLLSVDQTGHSRGSYNDEYRDRIAVTDRKIEAFLDWCRNEGFLDDALVLLTADHGQGIGIGGHGHMSPSEIRIPCILNGPGVPAGAVQEDPRFITDIATTVCATLGVRPPAASVGVDLLAPAPVSTGPAVFIIPARNEEQRLPGVLNAIAASGVPDRRVIVVDDGSSDGTAALAHEFGAHVVSHRESRGLGAALRTGMAAARSLSPRVAIYLDADGEYDARESSRLIAPIERGEADYVLGSRFRGHRTGMAASRDFANRAFSTLLSLCCRRWISDGQTGFRAFSPRALAVAEIVHDYNYAQVLTLDLMRKRMRMVEVPITYQRRAHGRSFISGQYLWRVPLGMIREMLTT